MILGIIGDGVVDVTGHREFTEKKVISLINRTKAKGLYGVVTYGDLGVSSIVQKMCIQMKIKYFLLPYNIPPETILDFVDYLAIIRRQTSYPRLDRVQSVCELPMLVITLDGREKWYNL